MLSRAQGFRHAPLGPPTPRFSAHQWTLNCPGGSHCILPLNCTLPRTARARSAHWADPERGPAARDASVLDLPVELIDVGDAILAVVVGLDDRAVAAVDEVARRRAVVGPLGRAVDCARDEREARELPHPAGQSIATEGNALPWLLGVPSWMNEIHCDCTRRDSSASPGRVPSVLAVLYGTPKT